MRRALAFLVLTSCTALREAPERVDSRPAILFVPGFYGSGLRAKDDGRLVYYGVKEALFGSSALSLFQEELGTPPGPAVEVAGVLEGVTVLPLLYEEAVYGPVLRRLQKARPDAQIVAVPYDWRDDLSLAVARIDATVKRLEESGCREISLVSHSMGGLAALYWLGYGTQAPEAARVSWEGARRVGRAIFFGTPFRGSMIAFATFEKGAGIPFAKRLLGPDAMSSFPAMFDLIPSPAVFRDRSGVPRTVDLFAPEIWRKHRFGLLRRTDLSAELVDRRERFQDRQLARARRWRELLTLRGAPPPPASFRALNVVGVGARTLEEGYLDPSSGVLLFSPRELKDAGLDGAPLFRDGDSTVETGRAALPQALAGVAKQVNVHALHTKLFLDPEAEKEYKGFLQNP